MPDESVKLCECGCGEPAPIATMTNTAKGRVKGQPSRFVSGHNTRKYPRGWVGRDCGYDTPCHVWTGSTNKSGYGWSTFTSATRLAHRNAWIAAHGPIPDGLFVCHHCDNPPCCNPAHLFLGTHQDNATDMVAKGRSHKPAGELDPAAKLTERDVCAIRAADGVPNKQLAARFGVSVVTISRVRNRRSWQSVKP